MSKGIGGHQKLGEIVYCEYMERFGVDTPDGHYPPYGAVLPEKRVQYEVIGRSLLAIVAEDLVTAAMEYERTAAVMYEQHPDYCRQCTAASAALRQCAASYSKGKLVNEKSKPC